MTLHLLFSLMFTNRYIHFGNINRIKNKFGFQKHNVKKLLVKQFKTENEELLAKFEATLLGEWCLFYLLLGEGMRGVCFGQKR